MSEGFKVGDVVTWKSQSAGHVKMKTGDVLEVLPTNAEPSDYNIVKSGGFILPGGGFGNPRNHESYLIRVEQGGKAKPVLYWPVVSGLRLEKKAAPMETPPLHGDLPGIPAPTGPLAHATREFVKRRTEIEGARSNLKEAGKAIMEAMIREGKTSIAVETHGERYKFTVKSAASRLHMTKMKREVTVGG